MDINEHIKKISYLLAVNDSYDNLLKEIDDLINVYSDNEKLYELKSKALYFSQKYDICLEFCEKALIIFPNNIKIMLDKAECLFQENKYQASYEIVNRILIIDKNNKEAKDLKKLLKSFLSNSFGERVFNNNFCNCFFEILNSKDFYKLIGIVIILLFVYYSPSSESMFCNSDYKCTYKRTYFNLYNVEKTYNISKNSFMSAKIKDYYINNKFNTTGYHSYPIIIDNSAEISPFIYYYSSGDTQKNAMQKLNNEINIFDNYVKNPDNNYLIEMDINPFIFYSKYIFFIIFLFLSFLHYKKTFGDKNS